MSAWVRVSEWVNEWANERTNERTNEWIMFFFCFIPVSWDMKMFFETRTWWTFIFESLRVIVCLKVKPLFGAACLRSLYHISVWKVCIIQFCLMGLYHTSAWEVCIIQFCLMGLYQMSKMIVLEVCINCLCQRRPVFLWIVVYFGLVLCEASFRKSSAAVTEI